MNFIPNVPDLFSILPALILAAGGVFLICLSVLFKTKEFLIVRYVSGLILLVAFGSVFYVAFQFPGNGTYFDGQIENSVLSFWLNLIYISMAVGTAAVVPRILKNHKIEFPEFYPLLLFATCGMVLMTAGQDFILVFVALELMSICLYILIGMARSDLFSLEATLKYFLLGSFSSGFMLMGIAFLFGGSGSTNITAALKPLIVSGYQGNFTKIGLVLFITGVAFKIARLDSGRVRGGFDSGYGIYVHCGKDGFRRTFTGSLYETSAAASRQHLGVVTGDSCVVIDGIREFTRIKTGKFKANACVFFHRARGLHCRGDIRRDQRRSIVLSHRIFFYEFGSVLYFGVFGRRN